VYGNELADRLATKRSTPPNSLSPT
jgi:hypothetical protein